MHRTMIATSTILLALATHAVAQDWPTRPMTLVVPFSAGGGVDVSARIQAQRMGELLGQTIIVENVGAAAGMAGGQRVAKAAPDGYTFLIGNSGTHAFNQSLYKKPLYNAVTDFQPVGLVSESPRILIVRKDLPVNSVSELIAHAKANPGKLNYASSGIGTTIHLSAELFKRMAGIDMVHVAYRGSAPALNDLLGQNVDLMFDNITSIIGQARAGAVKPLGITLPRRSSLAPDYPPIADTVPGYDTTSWTGVAVRAGTPAAICDKIEADTKIICQDPILKERLAGLVAEPVGSGAADFGAYVAAERAKWGKLITELKLRVE